MLSTYGFCRISSAVKEGPLNLCHLGSCAISHYLLWYSFAITRFAALAIAKSQVVFLKNKQEKQIGRIIKMGQ